MADSTQLPPLDGSGVFRVNRVNSDYSESLFGIFPGTQEGLNQARECLAKVKSGKWGNPQIDWCKFGEDYSATSPLTIN